MDEDLKTFVPILFYTLVVIGFAVTNLVLTHIIGPSRRTKVKDLPYESGMDPIGSPRQHFDIKFYLVAVVFLVFDVELLFLYPWAVTAYSDQNLLPLVLRPVVFNVMVAFMATLGIAYVYALKKGVFEWR